MKRCGSVSAAGRYWGERCASVEASAQERCCYTAGGPVQEGRRLVRGREVCPCTAMQGQCMLRALIRYIWLYMPRVHVVCPNQAYLALHPQCTAPIHQGVVLAIWQQVSPHLLVCVKCPNQAYLALHPHCTAPHSPGCWACRSAAGLAPPPCTCYEPQPAPMASDERSGGGSQTKVAKVPLVLRRMSCLQERCASSHKALGVDALCCKS